MDNSGTAYYVDSVNSLSITDGAPQPHQIFNWKKVPQRKTLIL